MAEEWNRAPEVFPGHPADGSYTVQPGDTLCGIACRFGVTLDVLVRANPQLAGAGFLHPGRIISIPAVPPLVTPPPPGPEKTRAGCPFGISFCPMRAACPFRRGRKRGRRRERERRGSWGCL